MPSRCRSLIRARSNSANAHHRQQQGGHGGVVAGEGELFFHELDRDAAGGEASDGGAEVVKVAGEAVHRVHQHGVAVADEREHRRQLRTVQVLALHVVGEDPVNIDSELVVPLLAARRSGQRLACVMDQRAVDPVELPTPTVA